MAENYAIGSAATKLLFNVNLASFVTGVTSGSDMGSGFYPGSDGGSRITLPELAGFSATGWSADNIGGTYNKTGSHLSFTGAIMDNVKMNALPQTAALFLLPIGFKLGRKLIRKPVNWTNRNVLKGSGVKI